MGKVASKVIKRPLKNFNVENRAHKLVDKDVKPIPAPHHSSSADFIDNFITENKEMLNKELLTKNSSHDKRLKGMVVQTTHPGDIKSKNRPLPEDRSKLEDTEYGYTEPSKLKHGHLSIKKVFTLTMEMLGKYCKEPQKHPVQDMAKEYAISQEDAELVVQYFKVFRMQLPKKEGGMDESTQSLLSPPLLDKVKKVNEEEALEKKT